MKPDRDSAGPLKLTGIGVSYGSQRVLEGIDLDLRPGEMHAILGRNGAGKSTLIRIVAGVVAPDGGEMHLGGRRFAPRSPRDAERLGVGTLYQGIDLVPSLSVAENFFLGREPRGPWGVDRGALERRAKERLADFSLDLDVASLVSELPLGTRQRLAFARAVDRAARVLLLDEPTAALSEPQARRCLDVLRSLRARGLAIVLALQDPSHALVLADRISVLRDGRRVGTWTRTEVDERFLAEAALGRAADEECEHLPGVGGRPSTARWFEVRGLVGEARSTPHDFGIAAGEVVGVAGRLGSGRSSFVRLLSGAVRAKSGARFVDGRETPFEGPTGALRQGVVLCPEDCRSDGLFPGLSVAENVALSLAPAHSVFGWVSRRRLERSAERWLRLLGLRERADERAGELSGSHQRCVALARALAADPRFLILDEPTRGIDVRAQRQIEEWVEGLAARGLSVLLVSSSPEDLVRRATRVIVLSDGRQVAELSGAELTLDALRAAIAAAGTRSDG